MTSRASRVKEGPLGGSAATIGERSGALAGGRYILHRRIATGGMAAVHLARLRGPAGFSRTVAIKRLHEHLASDPEFSAMLLDEARLAARIRHPNVVSTLDVVAEEGELFLVMDFVQGEALAMLIRASRAGGRFIPPPIAASIAAGALHGLHAAHEAVSDQGEPLGLVHRDVSPQNILVGTDGLARVVDFGVAKSIGRVQTTREGQLKGKLAYMAPEQIRGGQVSRRTDVFGAAVVLWEALTVQRLFTAESEGELVYRILEAEIEPPSLRAPAIPPGVDAVVMRGLERDPARRWPTALDMALALESAIAIAPNHEVGRWVVELGGDSVATRMREVQEIERSDAPGAQSSRTVRRPRGGETSDSASARSSTVEGSAASSLSVDAARIAGRRPRRWAGTIALVGAVAVATVIGAGIARRTYRRSLPTPDTVTSAPPTAASSSVTSPAAASTDQPPAPTDDRTPEPAASARPEPSASASAAPHGPAPKASGPRDRSRYYTRD